MAVEAVTGEVPVSFVVGGVLFLGTVWGVAKKFGPDLRRFYRFLDAWEGYTDADGTKVPGVLARLKSVEESATASASAVVALDGRVVHVSEQLEEVKASVEEVKDSQLAKAAELTQIRQVVEGLASGTDANPAPKGTFDLPKEQS